MLDGVMRKIINGPLDKMGLALAKIGISANGVTAFGLGVGLLAAALIATGFPLLGLIFIGLSRLADGLDGAVARATQKTDFGGYFDIVADFLFYGAIPLGFAIADPTQNAVVASVLLLSFYVNGASFLGFSVLAERRGMTTDTRGEKTIFFTDGLLEGTETILFFVAICVWSELFYLLASVFAAATFYTAAARMWRAYRQFGGSKNASEPPDL